MAHVAGTHLHNTGDTESKVVMAGQMLLRTRGRVLGFSKLDVGPLCRRFRNDTRRAPRNRLSKTKTGSYFVHGPKDTQYPVKVTCANTIERKPDIFPFIPSRPRHLEIAITAHPFYHIGVVEV
ncbi:MAG: hypothetical protein P8Y45_10505, partial [Exilibacterium sp.]